MASKFLRTGAKLGICTGAILAVGVIGAASSFAAVTYTVKAGTTTTGTTPVRGATQSLGGGNQIIFKDTTTAQTLGCASGTARGKATLGTAVAGPKVGTISSTTWKTCSGPAGIALVPKQVGTWKIAASGATSGGITKANVTGVTATVTGTGCSFTVKGAATGTFNNANQNLALAPVANPTAAQKLTVSGVAGCFGAINNGDNVTFTATYKLTATAGALTITKN